MDGNGPITGRARPLGYIIGGVDAIACEIACCKLVKIEASSVAIIETAGRLGFGCMEAEKIKIIGDDFTVCTDFEPAKPVPIRFSLPHICRSVAKQVVMLSNAGIKRLCGH
jgi:uncharacterized protein (DUF362 family)